AAAQATLASLNIVRTMYGLGYRIKLPDTKAIKLEEFIKRADVKIAHSHKEAEQTVKLLELLGWLGEKPINEMDASDDMLLKIRADERMAEIYHEAAGDLDLRVLQEGVSHIDVGGHPFRVEYTKQNPKGDKRINQVMDTVLEMGMHDEYVPDVCLVGPSTKFILKQQRKRPLDMSEAPHLNYVGDSDAVTFLQLSNLYTADNIKRYLETTGEEKRDSKTPSHLSSGAFVVHTISADGSEQHIDLIDAQDLRRVALNEKSIDSLLRELESKRKDLNRKELMKSIREKEEKRAYETIGVVVNVDDRHDGEADSYVQNSGKLIRDAAIEYLTQHHLYPDLLKISEIVDGNQNIKGIELAAQHNVFSQRQLEGIKENLRKDTSLSDDYRYDLLEEAATMMEEGMPRPTVDEQTEEALRSVFGDYVLDTVRNGGDVVVIGGDHSGRTTKHKGDGATRFRNGFHLARVNTPEGDTIRVSDRMYIPNQGELSGQMFYHGRNNLEGVNFYLTHKSHPDFMNQLRSIGTNVKQGNAGHNHHLEITHAGGQSTARPHGLVGFYNYVFEKGLNPGLHGTLVSLFPDQKWSLYKGSVSYDFTTDRALERASPEFERRKALRQDLMKYIPPK
ncbi:MAG: hypothetical protein ACOC32_00625, partial [Nanoarchaeota archaeon]